MHLKTYTINFTAITGKCHIYFRGASWESSDSLTNAAPPCANENCASQLTRYPTASATTLWPGTILLEVWKEMTWKELKAKLLNIQVYAHSGHRHGMAHRRVSLNADLSVKKQYFIGVFFFQKSVKNILQKNIQDNYS